MKKLRLILSLICLLSMSIFSTVAIAQISTGGLPPSFSLKNERVLSENAQLRMPITFSVKELLEEDEFNAKNQITRPRIAINIPVDISIDNSGEWFALPGEQEKRIWRVSVEAKGAEAIILSYDDFYLPVGSKLFIYNKDRTHVLGAFDNTSNPRGGAFSTRFVAGDIAVLEYVAPISTSRDKAKIKISGVGYGYNHIKIIPQTNETRLNPGRSNKCQVNVVCSPEGDFWKDNSKSVCQITALIGLNWAVCSGTLLNNTANDMTPYILSAFHCYTGATKEDLLKWQFNFFYKSKECATNTGYYDDMETLVGADLIVTTPMRGGSDGLLLKLKENIPGEWIANERIIWAGWDRRADASIMAKSGVSIHHPAGDMQKIATYTKQAELLSNQNFGGGKITGIYAHWGVYFDKTPNGWSETQGGSSGSCLINQENRVIGSLSGGPDGFDCTEATAMSNFGMYGAMSYHWDQFGDSPETQMKTWLDPKGEGSAEICDAYPTQANTINFLGDRREIYVLESVKFSGAALKADSIRWFFPGGNPATSTEYSPTVSYDKPEPGSFGVKLMAYTKTAKGKDTILTEEKANYITTTIKGNPEPPKAHIVAYKVVKDIIDDDFSTSKIGDDKEYQQEIIKDSRFKWTISNHPSGHEPAHHGFDGHGDNFLWYFPRSYTSKARVSRSFEATSSADIKLSFQMLIRPFAADVDTLFVEYKAEGADKWDVIYSSNGTATCAHMDAPDVWKLIEIELPKNTATKGRLAFRANSAWGKGIAIDNVKLQEMEIAENLEIWEGDHVRFFNFSTGTPVLYKYNFDGGNPSETTTEDLIIRVDYDSAGSYNVSQWVKNTKGENKQTHPNYIKVMKRVLKASTESVFAECAQAIDKTITLTANKNWIAKTPDWIEISPTFGNVQNPGKEEPFEIQIKVLENPDTTKGRLGYITFELADGVNTVNVKVAQSTIAPTKLDAKTKDSVNVKLTWVPVPGTYIPPPGPCDINVGGGGTFEDEALYNSNWTSWHFGDVSPVYNPNGWLWSKKAVFPPREGVACMISYSYINDGSYQLNADNWLITPKLKVTEDLHTLKFWIASQATKVFDHYEVRLSKASTITDTSTFTEILIPLTEAGHFWTKVEHDLTDYIGDEVFIAFRHKQFAKFILKIDNVSGLELASNCDPTATTTQEPRMLSSNNAVIIPRTSHNEVADKNTEGETSTQAETSNYSLESALIDKSMVLKTEQVPFDASSLKQFYWCRREAPTRAIGASGKPFWVAAKWSGEDLEPLKGATIEAIEITLGLEIEVELFIMEGKTELHSQIVPAGDLKIAVPKIIKLSKSVNIFGGQDVYIGYKVLVPYDGRPVAVDNGPQVKGRGNMIYWLEDEKWMQLTNLGEKLTYNWYIIAYGEGGGDGYTIYRKRLTGGDDQEYKFVAANVTDTTYFDKNLIPGGDYSYKVTYWSDGTESCPTNEDTTFVLYQQKLDEAKLIKKTYGDENFMIDASAKDGNLLRSSVDDIDFFKNKNLAPVSLAIQGEDKGVITLKGEPGSYSVTINKVGEAMLEATQEGIKDTLLAAEPIKIKVAVDRLNLTVKAQDKEKFYGENNPPLELIYGPFAYGDNPSNLAKLPEINCYATASTLPGKEPIVVSVFDDPNYKLKAEHGVLTIKPAGEGDYINIFTPYSADGYNDYFMPGYKIKVFNRQGILIYETSNTQELNIGWNGKIRQTQKMAEPGVYYYVVVDDKGKTIRNGSVTLVK